MAKKIFRDDLDIIQIPQGSFSDKEDGSEIIIKYQQEWSLKPKDIFHWDDSESTGAAEVIKAGGRECTIKKLW